MDTQVLETEKKAVEKSIAKHGETFLVGVIEDNCERLNKLALEELKKVIPGEFLDGFVDMIAPHLVPAVKGALLKLAQGISDEV